MDMTLTARQEAFCRAFVSGAGSAAEAARVAGYSVHTARAQASRLLHTPAVVARLDALRADGEAAKAATCARLWDRTQRLMDRAEAEGHIGLALRGVAMQMQLVKQFGLPAAPADTYERSLEGLGADPVEVCGDVAVGEDMLTDVDAEVPTDVAETTRNMGATFLPTWVAGELRRLATHNPRPVAPVLTDVNAHERADAATPATVGAAPNDVVMGTCHPHGPNRQRPPLGKRTPKATVVAWPQRDKMDGILTDVDTLRAARAAG